MLSVFSLPSHPADSITYYGIVVYGDLVSFQMDEFLTPMLPFLSSYSFESFEAIYTIQPYALIA